MGGNDPFKLGLIGQNNYNPAINGGVQRTGYVNPNGGKPSGSIGSDNGLKKPFDYHNLDKYDNPNVPQNDFLSLTSRNYNTSPITPVENVDKQLAGANKLYGQYEQALGYGLNHGNSAVDNREVREIGIA